MPSRSLAYNPDAPINAEQRAKNAKAAGARKTHADAVGSFSPWELEELRMDLLALATERAARFVTLIDAHEAAQDLDTNVRGALDNAAMNETLETVETAAEEVRGELRKEWEDRLADELGDLKDPTPEDLVKAFKVWHEAELDRVADSIDGHLNPVTVAIQNARDALAVLD